MTHAFANHPSGAILDCTPEQAANPTTGTAGGAQNTGNRHTVTCTLEDPNTGNPVQANNGPLAIDFEIDCFSGCGDAAYTTTTANPTTGQATVSPTPPEAGDDGDDAVGTNDDIRQNSVEMTCVISAGTASCRVTYQRTDAATGGPGAGDIDLVAAWIDHDGSDTTDESDPTETPGGEDNDNTDTVQKNWETRQANNVDCGPSTATNPTGTQHTTTCTTTDQFGQPVEGAPGPVVTSGGANTTTNCDATTNQGGQGSCQMVNNGNPDTVTVRQCTVDSAAGTGNCDVQVKNFEQPTAATVDAEPETDTNTVGEQHTITAFVQNQFQGGQGTGAQGATNVQVNFEFHQGSPHDTDAGTNTAPDRTCTTVANQGGTGGTCTITYSGTTAGTDAISVWVGNATPAGTNLSPSCDGEGVGQANDPNCDVVLKTWEARQPTTLDCSPEDATNPPGSTQHTITCQIIDQFGVNLGVANVQVDGEMLAGSANDADGTAAPPDFSQQTNNNGVATFTYNNPAAHATDRVDNICFWIDNDNDTELDGDCAEVLDTVDNDNTDVVRKTWTRTQPPPPAQNPAQTIEVRLTPDAPTSAVGVCQQFTVNITQTVNNQTQPVANQTVDVLATFENPPAAGQPNQPDVQFCQPPAGSGPNIRNPNNQTPGAGTPSFPAGTPPLIQPGGAPNQRHGEFTTDANGQVTFGVLSTQPGTVTVRAFIDTNSNNSPDDTIQDTSTMTVTAGAARARTVEATPTIATNPVGTTHTIDVTVRGQASGDQPGPVVPGVPVNARVTSTQNGGNPNTQLNCGTTDAGGRTTCTYQGANAGTDTITVWVNQESQNNQPATTGPDSGEPQTTVTKTWTGPPQCDDGIDNDSDGLTDFGDDPGCADANDNSELPANDPDPDPEPESFHHDRTISIDFNDGTGNQGLVVFGRLRAEGFQGCYANQPVNIQRRIGDRWVTKKTTNTNRRGRYAVEVSDRESRYRVVAPRTELVDLDNNRADICARAVRTKTHRH